MDSKKGHGRIMRLSPLTCLLVGCVFVIVGARLRVADDDASAIGVLTRSRKWGAFVLGGGFILLAIRLWLRQGT